MLCRECEAKRFKEHEHYHGDTSFLNPYAVINDIKVTLKTLTTL